MKFVVAALLGAVSARHHHHHNLVQLQGDGDAKAAAAEPAEVAGDKPETPEEVAQDMAEKKAEKKPMSPEDAKAAADAVLADKPVKTGSAFEAQLAAARAVDAAEAGEVAKYDAVGKSIIAGMYEARAQAKIDAAAKAKAAQVAMVDILAAREAANEAAEKARQADAFKAHKAHVLHVKEHYANLEAGAAKEVQAAHDAWKSRYGAQKRLPADTAGETWTANMPDHVIDEPDFYQRPPAPLAKVMADAKKAEAAAEGAAEAPAAFVQLSRRNQKLAQKRAAESSESSESESSASSSGSSSSGSSESN